MPTQQNPFAKLFGGLMAQPQPNQPKQSFVSSLFNTAPTGANMSTNQGPKKAPAPLASNIGATPPMSVAPKAAQTPPTTPTQSPAGQEYIKSIATEGNTIASTPPPSTIFGQNPNAGKFGTGGISAPEAPDPQASYKSAYEAYIKALSPSTEEERAAKSVSDFDIQALKDQEDALDRGETLGFASGEAQRVNKNNAFERMARASSLEALTGRRSATTDAAKARVDFEKSLMPKPAESFTLGPDEVRYGADGKVIASGANSSNNAGPYAPGANPQVDAYAKAVQNGTLKLENVPTTLRGSVAQALASLPEAADPKKQYVKGQADEALTNIDKALGILKGPVDESPLGPSVRAVAGLIPGSGTSDLNATLDTVKALVGFDALQKMRDSSPTGGALGQITERELAFLQSVQGSLSSMQSTKQLTETLARIRKSFQTLQLVNSPDGTPFELDGTTYYKQGDQLVPEGFNSAGNASASTGKNRPQKNNNPLNIKMSNATSTYPGVVGTDKKAASDGGNFLVFDSPESGFAAAKKLLGADSYRNLTVDAAMRRWSNNGYGGDIAPSLASKTVGKLSPAELNTLIQTMARREGYYG